MNEQNKQSTISVDVEVLKKLSAISTRAKLSKVEILTEWINAVYSIMADSIESTNRVTIGTFPDLKNSQVVIKLGAFSFGGIENLPKFVQSFFECEKKIEDIQLSGHQPTLEEMLALGFKKEDVQKLLREKVKS